MNNHKKNNNTFNENEIDNPSSPSSSSSTSPFLNTTSNSNTSSTTKRKCKRKPIIKKRKTTTKPKQITPQPKNNNSSKISCNQYSSGYTPTNKEMKDLMNGYITKQVERKKCKQAGWYILLDHTDFRTTTAIYDSGTIDRELFLDNLVIPQNDRDAYNEMKEHEVFGKNVMFGDLCDIIIEELSPEKPIYVLYMDFTCGPSRAIKILKRLYKSDHELKNTLCGITVGCHDNEKANYTNQGITRLSNYIYNKFDIRNVLYKEFEEMEDIDIFKSYGKEMLMFTSLFTIQHKR